MNSNSSDDEESSHQKTVMDDKDGNISTDDESTVNMLEMSNIVQNGNQLKAQVKYVHEKLGELMVFKSPQYMIRGIIPVQLKVVSFCDNGGVENGFGRVTYKCKLYVTTENIENMKITLNFSSDSLNIPSKRFNLVKRRKVRVHEMTQRNLRTFIFDITLNAKLAAVRGKFESMYDDTDLTDFEFNGKDGSVQLHKFVIAASSDAFKRMLCTNMKEAATGKIDFNDTSKATLEQLKIYLYKGKVPASDLKELLLLGHCYLIPGLEYKCIEKMVYSLTAENYLDLEEFAIRNQITNLRLALLERVQSGGILVRDIKECLTIKPAQIKSAQKRSLSPVLEVDAQQGRRTRRKV